MCKLSCSVNTYICTHRYTLYTDRQIHTIHRQTDTHVHSQVQTHTTTLVVIVHIPHVEATVGGGGKG